MGGSKRIENNASQLALMDELGKKGELAKKDEIGKKDDK